MFHISNPLKVSVSFNNSVKENPGKFDPTSDGSIFFRYSSVSKANHVHNKHFEVIEEFIHVIFDEINDGLTSSSSFDGF